MNVAIDDVWAGFPSSGFYHRRVLVKLLITIIWCSSEKSSLFPNGFELISGSVGAELQDRLGMETLRA